MNTATSSAGVRTPGPTSTLFRPEVLTARQAQWLGSIRLGRPLSFSVVTVTALSMAAALIAFAGWGDVTRKVTVHGLLLPEGGLINVAAQQAGVIADVFVQEGDLVQAGQPLLRLRSERITAAGDTALLTAQALATRRTTLEVERRLTEQNLRQRLDSLMQRQQSLQGEERQALAELDTHQLRLQLGKKSLERQQQLAYDGFVAAAQVQQRQEELLDLQLRARNAERSLQALQRDLQTVRADRQTLEMQTQTALAQLDRSLATLDQEAMEADGRNGLTLTAPQGGRISAITLGPGQYVQVAQTLVSLIPTASSTESATNAAELQAQLFAPSRTAGFVQPGQTVWLRYAAYPYQKFGMGQGEVMTVSRSPIAPQDFPNGQGQTLVVAAQANEPMYRITVRLRRQTVNIYGKPTRLAAGMSLSAEVRQDSRKVWEWLLEPALAVVGGRKNLSDETKSSPGG